MAATHYDSRLAIRIVAVPALRQGISPRRILRETLSQLSSSNLVGRWVLAYRPCFGCPRYCSSITETFVSEDPIWFYGGDPARFAEGQNFFAYVHNDVTNSGDPFGLGPNLASPRPFANTVATCQQRFQECKNKAWDNALHGGFIVFAASAIGFDTAMGGCIGLTGPLFGECALAVEAVQTAATPILLAPFGGNYFDNIANCSNQKAVCLAQLCKK